MTHIMGCVFPVEAANRERFVEQAVTIASVFRELGAVGVVDALGDDVPPGQVTDFYRAVAAREGEIVGFGWVEWADEASAKAAEERMRADPRMDMSDMAFDGRRMIFGGFEKVVDEGTGGAFGYVDGFLLAVPTANRETFIRHCLDAAPLFLRHGATRHVECWGVDVPEGKVTDFHRAVKREAGETVCFSWIEWPDRATRDRGQKAVFAEMETAMADNPMPFDGRRMVFGGFEVVSGGR